jgi:hypothetical protein
MDAHGPEPAAAGQSGGRTLTEAFEAAARSNVVAGTIAAQSLVARVFADSAVSRLAESIATMERFLGQAGRDASRPRPRPVPQVIESPAPPARAASAARPSRRRKRIAEPREVWLARAMFTVKKHPEWSDAEVAKAVGVHKSTLCRCDEYKIAAAIARKPRSPRRGYRDRSGDVVAVVASTVLPSEAEPISGSRYYRAKCMGCGESIRVPESQRDSPQCDDCGT